MPLYFIACAWNYNENFLSLFFGCWRVWAWGKRWFCNLTKAFQVRTISSNCPFGPKLSLFVWWFIIWLGSMFELMDWFMVDLNWHTELLGWSWWLCALQDHNKMVQLHLFLDFEIETRFASFNHLHCISISFPFINFDCISPLWWDWTGFWIGYCSWLFVLE